MRYTFYTLCFLFIAATSQAQTDTVRLVVSDELIGNAEDDLDTNFIVSNVNVFKDPRLDALKARPKMVMREEVRAEIVKKRTDKQAASNVTNYAPVSRGTKKVTGSIVTKKGYRVVIYSGSNRTEALEMKRKFIRAYPGTRSYMSYISPYFKIRVGNFESKTSAYKFLRQIQGRGFSKSFVAPDIVTIKDINVR